MSSGTVMRTLSTEEELRDGLREIQTILIDCDGVLWRGASPIEGAGDLLQRLLSSGKRVVLLTNNSTKSRKMYVDKVRTLLGVEVGVEHIVSSSYAAAAYLERVGFRGRAFVVGESGLKEELELAGVEVVGCFGEDGKSFDASAFEVEKDIPKDVGAVVVGLDTKFTYYKLCIAAYLARQRDAVRFVATNTDKTFPGKECILPGSGSIVQAVETAAQREVDVVVGKPSKTLLDLVHSEDTPIDPRKTLMIGDRLDTDMLFGVSCCLQTAMVLTGISTLEQASVAPETMSPKFIVPSIASLTSALL